MRNTVCLASILCIWIGASAPAFAAEETLTDTVVVDYVSRRPPAGSGIIHFLVRVGAVTKSGERRDYYITYYDESQMLPGVGAGCDITYRQQVFGGIVGEWQENLKTGTWRSVSRVSCVGPYLFWDERAFLAKGQRTKKERR